MARKLVDAFVRFWAPGFWPPLETYTLVVVLTLIAFGQGCAGSFEEARAANVAVGAPANTPERCAELDDRRQLAGFGGKVFGGLAGVAAATTLLLEDDRYEAARIGVAVGGGVSGAFAAGSVWVAETSGESWARECAAR